VPSSGDAVCCRFPVFLSESSETLRTKLHNCTSLVHSAGLAALLPYLVQLVGEGATPTAAVCRHTKHWHRHQPPFVTQIVCARMHDAGLAALVPYLVQMVGEGVAGGLRDMGRLSRLLAATRALLANPHLGLAPYLHQLLPPVLTCLVARRLGVRGCRSILKPNPET